MRRLQRVYRGTRQLLLGDREDFDLGLVLLLLGVAAAAWAFVALADQVLEGDTHDFDREILLFLRTPGDTKDPLGPPWVEEAMRDFTAFGGVAALTAISLVVVGYLFLERRWAHALLVVAAVTSGVGLSSLLKFGFDRPRPDLVSHGSYVATSSFPSGHSMVAAVAYLTLGALLARSQRRTHLKVYIVSCAALLTLVVGASRVYLGVHWPSDVLAGWAGGAGWAALCTYLALRLQRRGKVEPAE